MSKSIPDEFRNLFDKRAYASLGTLRSDGWPQVTPVWCDADGGSVIINTAKGRHQDKNIRNDARVALIITDPGNPYRYLEIRGRAVEVPGPVADAHLDRMAKKYLATETYTYKQAGEVRVMYKIQAERVNGFSFPHAEHLSSSKNRLLVRQKFVLLISKGNFGDSKFARYSDYRHRSVDFRHRWRQRLYRCGARKSRQPRQ